MEAKKAVQFQLNSDLYEKFKMTLVLNKTTQEAALEALIRRYIADSFTDAAKQLSKNIDRSFAHNVVDEKIDEDFAKARRKIPGWSQKPYQNNHRIIKAFFELEKDQGLVSLAALEERCRDPIKFPATYLADFRGNFNSMKTDAGNSHGKVFEVDEDVVRIWGEIEDFLLTYKEAFLGTDETKLFTKVFTDLLKYVKNLDPQARFSIKTLFPEQWETIPFSIRRQIGRSFFSYVQKEILADIKALPEKDSDGSQLYQKNP